MTLKLPDAGDGPLLLSSGQSNPLLAEDRANSVAALGSPRHDRAPMNHQSPTLSLLWIGQMHRGQLIQQCQPRQLERIILIGLSLDPLPAPSLIVGIDDHDLYDQGRNFIMHPAAGVAGIKHHQRLRRIDRHMLPNRLADRDWRRVDRHKTMRSGCYIHHAQNRLELAQIDSHNSLIAHAISFGRGPPLIFTDQRRDCMGSMLWTAPRRGESLSLV